MRRTTLPVQGTDWSVSHPSGQAKCRPFVPNSGYDAFFDDQKEAIKFCNGSFDGVVCPRRTECFLASMRNTEVYGVWGGTTEKVRRTLRVLHPDDPAMWMRYVTESGVWE